MSLSPTLRKWLFVPPVLLGGLLVWYTISSRQPPKQAPAVEFSPHVRVLVVRSTDVVPRVRGFGTVKPAKSWSGIAQVSGRIEYVHPRFKQGAILAAGTEIVRISTADYKLAIVEAKALIRSAEAKLAELKVSKSNTEELLRIEKESLLLKEKSIKAKRGLLERGTVAQLSFDNELRDLLSQKKKVQDLHNLLQLLPTQLDVQGEQIEVNKVKLETAKLNLSRTHIRLPFDARIASVDVEVSQFVQIGAALGAADGILRAEINAQYAISHLKPFFKAVDRAGKAHEKVTTEEKTEAGARGPAKIRKPSGLYSIVRLVTGAGDVTWKGTVDRSNDTLDEQTRTVGIITVVEGSYAKAVVGKRPPLIKGMFVEVELLAKPFKGRVVLPPSAVHGQKVYVVGNNKRLNIRNVRLGFVGPGYVIVEDGLVAGERVVVSDISPVLPGMLLKVTRDLAIEETLMAAASGKAGATP